MSNEKFYQSGSGQALEGASRSLEEVTAKELMSTFGANPSREKLRVTRFPVSLEEFLQLKSEVESAQPALESAEEESSINQQDNPLDELVQDEFPEIDQSESLAPAVTSTFSGIQQTAFRPPDCTVAVGPDDVMVGVNTTMAIYSKAGSLKLTWNFDSMFRPVLPPNARIFDPKIIYDHYSNRWVVLLDATRGSPQGAWLMVGVSQTSNPLGSYWLWALDATQDGSNPTNNWADYSQLGFDTRAIYITNNMFKFGGGFSYAKIRILNKSQLYSGSSVQWYDFWNIKNPDGSIAFTLQPAVHYIGTGGNPPAYFVNALWPSGTSLTKWTLTNPLGFWGVGGSPGLTRVAVNCIRYDLPPDAQQQGSTTPIETNDSRLLNAIYQFHGDGTKRLWTSHTTRHTWPGDSASVSVIQWYEIDINSNTVIQQSRFGAPKQYYFFPAIQTNISRDAFIIFGRSSSTGFSQLRQTGRRSTAPVNSLEGSILVKDGESSYTGQRWGDYFGVCRDPAIPKKAWLYGEYAESGNTWGTWICSGQY
jgi:hypothetical protein